MANKATLTYLLPPNSIIEEIEKSPKLQLSEGFRVNNWKDVMGEFYCNMKDIDIQISSDEAKLKKHLNSLNTNKVKDNYIYSLFRIDKINDTTFYCCHYYDITMKHDGVYSRKSSQCSTCIQPYTVKIQNRNIISQFGSQVEKN